MTFEEAKKKSVSCIYCMEFPNGKKYVGKTKDLGDRIRLYERYGNGNKALSGAIDEFSVESTSISVLSEVKCANRIDLELCLSILEVKYIRELGTTDAEKGYNVSFGGEVLGIPIGYLTTDKDTVNAYNTGCKAVLLYDENGDFVKEYESIAKCSYDIGVDETIISGCLDTKKFFIGKWYLRTKRYDYAPKHIEICAPKSKERVVYKDVIVEREKIQTVVVPKIVEKLVERKVVVKPHILKYNMDGEFCGEYDCFKDACMSFTNSASGITCGIYRKGYILFKKQGDDYPKQIEPYHVLNKKITGEYYRPAEELEDKSSSKKPTDKKKVGRPRKEMTSDAKTYYNHVRVDGKNANINNNFAIGQYSLEGELLSTYDNVRDASHYTGIQYSNIMACVKGVTKKAHGFIWKRLDEQ